MNKQFPLVSIITPAYNQAEYLEATIQSVLAQSYPNIEYIILDDGSTDRTAEILKSYNGIVRWETHQNMGQAKTLNKGWDMSKGEFLSYLSSDDLLDPHAVARLMERFDRHPSVIFGGYRLIDQVGKTIKAKKTVFLGYDDMVHNFSCPIGPGAIFSRSLFQASGGWNPEFRQIPDYDFWTRVGNGGANFVRVEEELASFRVHTDSQTFASSSIAKSDESIQSVTQLFNERGSVAALSRRRSLASAYVYSSCLHLRSGRSGMALRRLIQAVQYGGRYAVSARNCVRFFGSAYSIFRYRNIKKSST